MVLGHKKRTSLQSTMTPKHKLKAFRKEFRTKPTIWGCSKNWSRCKLPINFQLPNHHLGLESPGSFFQNGNLNNLRFVSVIIHPNRSSSDVRWARIPLGNLVDELFSPIPDSQKSEAQCWLIQPFPLVLWKNPHSRETNKKSAVFDKTGGC